VRGALATAATLISVTLQGLAAVGWAEESRDDSAQSRPSSKEPAGIDQPWQAWWRSAEEELFAGIALSAEQQQAVEAIVAEATADRARGRELRQELAVARREGDDARLERVRAELWMLRPRLGPEWRIDAMGDLLTEDQRAIFDKQRRLRSDRLCAEESRGRRPGQPGRRGPAPPTLPGAAPEAPSIAEAREQP